MLAARGANRPSGLVRIASLPFIRIARELQCGHVSHTASAGGAVLAQNTQRCVHDPDIDRSELRKATVVCCPSGSNFRASGVLPCRPHRVRPPLPAALRQYSIHGNLFIASFDGWGWTRHSKVHTWGAVPLPAPCRRAKQQSGDRGGIGDR
jgi:hypothetical protein